MRLILIAIIAASLTECALFGSVSGASLSDQVRKELQHRIDLAQSAPKLVSREALLCDSSVLRRFYERRSFRAAWSADDGPLPHTEHLVQAAQQADQDGLRPDDYHLSSIQAMLNEIQQDLAQHRPLGPEKMADLDLLLTDAFLVFVSDVLVGRVNPETIHAEWQGEIRKVDAAELLETGLKTHQLEKVLKGLSPTHPGYTRLRTELADYRAMAEEGGWPVVPGGPNMRKGDPGAQVKVLRKRLAVTGDPVVMHETTVDLFDDALDRAVRRFQRMFTLQESAPMRRNMFI